MARYALRNIVVIFVLCVAVLLISGIALPKLISNQYLKLRSELNAYSHQSLKQDPNATVVGQLIHVSKNDSIHSNTNTSALESLQLRDFSPETIPFTSKKVKKRSKRRASYKNGNELFAWNFNFNITRYENNTPQMPIENNEATMSSVKNKNYLGMAVYVEGNGPKQNNNELENAWNSVGNFIRSLFGESVESVPAQMKQTKESGKVVFSFNGALQTDSDLDATEKLRNFDEGSGDEPLNVSGRDGRWLDFGFLRFGGQSLDKTTSFPQKSLGSVTDTTDPSIFFKEGERDENIFKDFLTTTDLQKFELSTEMSNIDFQSNSNNKPRRPATEPVFIENVRENASENADQDFGIAPFGPKNSIAEDNECSGCEHSSIELPVTPNVMEDNVSEDISQTNAFLFTDEEFEKYCMILKQKFDSQEHRSLTVGNSGTEPSMKNPEHEAHQLLDIYNLMKTFEESKLKTDGGIIENSFAGTDESTLPRTNPAMNKEGRFLNWNMLGFGSGRSAIETADFTFDEPNLETTKEFKNLPSIIDCENYLSEQNIITSSKPNLDAIDSNIKLTDLLDSTILPQFKEQELQLPDTIKTSLNNSYVKYHDTDSENVIKSTIPDEENVVSPKENLISLSLKNKWSAEENNSYVKYHDTDSENLIKSTIPDEENVVSPKENLISLSLKNKWSAEENNSYVKYHDTDSENLIKSTIPDEENVVSPKENLISLSLKNKWSAEENNSYVKYHDTDSENVIKSTIPDEENVVSPKENLISLSLKNKWSAEENNSYVKYHDTDSENLIKSTIPDEENVVSPKENLISLSLKNKWSAEENNSYVKYHDTDSENLIKFTTPDEENIVSPEGNPISLSLKNKWSTEEYSVALNQDTVPDLNNQLVTEGNMENQHATESQRDGRFFSIFGFGSGSSPEVASAGNDERFFLGSFLGSGEGRLLESSDLITESDTSLLGSEDSFQEIDFLSSGDPRILDSFSTTGKLEDKATTVQERRFWGLLGFAGSGDGRLSNVNMDNETEIAPLIENGCENDCFLESNNTDYSNDCSDDLCELKNSHDHTMITEFPKKYPITEEINCEGNCFHESNNTDSSSDCNDDQCYFENSHNHTMATEFLNEYPITNESDCKDDCFYESNNTDSNYDCNDDQCDFKTSHNHTKVSEFPREYPIIEINCEDDCFQESNNTDSSYDCNGDQCDFENPHNHTMVTEFPNEHPITKESDCEDDCFYESNNTDSNYDCNDDQCDVENSHNHTMATEFLNEYPITNESDCKDDCFYESNNTDSNYDCNDDQCDFKTSHNHTKVSEFPRDYPIREINCEDDCFQESNNTDSSYDCNGDQCDFENPHNHTMVTEFPNEHPITKESDCEDDCFYESNNTDSNYDCNDDQCDVENSHNHTMATEFLNEYPITNESDCKDDCFYESNNTDSNYDCNDDQCDFKTSHNHTKVSEFPRDYPIREINCEDDCFQESNNTDSSYDCNGDQCDFENPHNHTMVTEFPNEHPITKESDCEDDCFYESNNTDSNYDCNDDQCDFETSHNHTKFSGFPNDPDCQTNCFHATSEMSNESITESILIGIYDENLTTVDMSNIENCNDCSHETYEVSLTSHTLSKENNSLFECGDCDSNVYEMQNNSLADIEKKLSMQTASESGNVNNSYQSFENDCNECSYENDSFYNEQQKSQIDDASEILPSYTEDLGLFKISEYGNSIKDKASTFHADAIDIGGYTEVNKEVGTELTDILVKKEQTTEQSRRFLGTIFLTGSGDGGLLEDSGGPINLIEEDSTIKQPVRFSRRGRLDDTLEVGNQSSLNPELEPISMNEERSTIKSPTQFPRRRARLDDTIPVDDQSHKVQIQDDASSNITDFNLNNMDDSTLTYFSSKERADGEMTVAVNLTHSPDTFSKRILNFPSDVYKMAIQPRFCIGANQCNPERNERCIMKGNSSVCDCNRHFIRNKETGKCVVKNMFEASLMFPGEEFDEDLTNPNSSRYQQKRKDSIDTMWMLLSENPEILRIVAEVDVAEFRAGSLIVSWNLIIAAENETEPDLANYVQSASTNLNKALENSALVQKASLNIKNASVIAISNNLDPCTASESNYCSKHAECKRNGAFPGGFVCSCKDNYLDTSINRDYPGEVCEAFCPPYYCGKKGHCELKDEGIRCLCSGWQFGNRCEISGIVVVATFSVNIVVIVVVVILMVLCKGRCRKRRYGGTQRFQPYEETGTRRRSGRLSDVIALEENTGARVAKFATISTPMQDLPVIKVTRPTLNESSISFDYDSTFDVTPSTSQIQNNIDQEAPSTV